MLQFKFNVLLLINLLILTIFFFFLNKPKYFQNMFVKTSENLQDFCDILG